MTPQAALLIMSSLIFKHFIFDFPISMQTPWMFLNKGKYGHPGGLAHAGLHIVGTFLVIPWALVFYKPFIF